METRATDLYPKIDWELGDRYDDAGDGHCFMHHATGESEDGIKWSATGIVVDGQFEEVEDIEEIL